MQIAYTYKFSKVRNLKTTLYGNFRKCNTRFYPVRNGAVQYKVLVMARASVSVTSLVYGISPIVTNVSVLSDLRISGCELKDNHNISFIMLFKTIFYL